MALHALRVRALVARRYIHQGFARCGIRMALRKFVVLDVCKAGAVHRRYIQPVLNEYIR